MKSAKHMLTTIDIAHAAGLDLKRQGARWFTHSPFRNERTASLCIYPDGRWYDFGDGKHGDAADLYAALYSVSLGEALRVIRGVEWHPKPRAPSVFDLKRAIDTWKGSHWREACSKKHTAQAIIREPGGPAPESEQFWQAVADAAAANDTLFYLESMTPRQALQMMDGGDTNEQPV